MYLGWLTPKSMKTYVMSPELEVDRPSCLRFWYQLRCYLEVKWISDVKTKTLALWEVDGGNEFHESCIELPSGTFNLVFEVTATIHCSDLSACIDGIRVNPEPCSYASKSRI